MSDPLYTVEPVHDTPGAMSDRGVIVDYSPRYERGSTMARVKVMERQPVDQFTAEVMEYRLLKAQTDEMTKRIKVLRDSLMESVQALGLEDDKGHVFLALDDDIDGVTELVAERRVVQSINEEAAQDLLQEKGLLDRCTEMVRVVNQDEVMAARFDDLLTDDDVDAMFDIKVTYALKMK